MAAVIGPEGHSVKRFGASRRTAEAEQPPPSRRNIAREHPEALPISARLTEDSARGSETYEPCAALSD